jgi:hypothetical protein
VFRANEKRLWASGVSYLYPKLPVKNGGLQWKKTWTRNAAIAGAGDGLLYGETAFDLMLISCGFRHREACLQMLCSRKNKRPCFRLHCI